MPPGRFAHLDARSYFSIKEGAFSPEQLARRAAELGMDSVALTDRDGLYGVARFVAACEREGVRPILGASLTLRGGSIPHARASTPYVTEIGGWTVAVIGSGGVNPETGSWLALDGAIAALR